MSFTKTKDRIWKAYNLFAGWLAHRPEPVRKAGYWIFGGVLWIAYLLPRSSVRATFQALAAQVGQAKPRRLFADYVRGFMRGMNRTEQLRHGMTDEVEKMLKIPEQDRLDALLQERGVVLVIPHSHASLAMGRGLSQRYPVLALVRSTRNEQRAASEREIYESFGCEFLDVRRENATVVARKVLKALSQKRLIIGTVDRISMAPPADHPINAQTDTVRAMAFGEPIGIAGWPARFSLRGDNPIIPVIVDQTEKDMTLVLGKSIRPTSDLLETTQAWVTEMEKHMRTHPDEWAFSLDKHWSRVLRNAQSSLQKP